MKREGEVSVLDPIIVSASRSTDIPAFYSNWFINRIRAGYCCWVNPFNREVFRVSFEKMRMIVFWTKNPKPMLARLDELESFGYKNYYFQVTLNDYVQGRLEPHVPPVEDRIETFQALADRIGKERVIWRFDPLLLSDTLTIDVLLERINRIGSAIKGCTEKLVFSFADVLAYRKVVKNLEETSCREFTIAEKVAFAKGLHEINLGLGLEMATCAEDIDLSAYGIRHNKCVDDELMVRLFHDDSVLMEFLGAEYDMFDGWTLKKSKKDQGQRKACGCVVSKDIGMYNTCPHLCRYCYANSSDELVLKNRARIRNDAESLLA